MAREPYTVHAELVDMHRDGGLDERAAEAGAVRIRAAHARELAAAARATGTAPRGPRTPSPPRASWRPTRRSWRGRRAPPRQGRGTPRGTSTGTCPPPLTCGDTASRAPCPRPGGRVSLPVSPELGTRRGHPSQSRLTL